MPADTSSRHLLVVDDDEDILRLLSRYFGNQGFRVSTAGSGAALRATFDRSDVDLVLLDLGLPDEDGLELIRFLRAKWDGPVIVVTGRGDSVDRVVGLEIGADDYVTKPFDLRELLARVRSVLRRARPSTSEVAAADPGERVLFEGHVLDLASRTLRRSDGSEVELTSGEFELLQAFVEQPNRVLSRDALMNRLHGRDAGPYDRAIDVRVGRLRRKLEPDADSPRLIKAIRGAGYQFTARLQRTP